MHSPLVWLSDNHHRLAALRGVTIVVKVGGSIQDVPDQLRRVMHDVAVLASIGARPVVVHGGGKAISAAMKSAGLEPRFVAGQRFTDEPTLRIAERVLAEQVNAELIDMLDDCGVAAQGLHSLGSCVLQAERHTPGGHDLGLVGRVTTVNTTILLALLAEGIVPVIAPIAMAPGDREGPGKLNVNADLAGGKVAAAMRAPVFVLVSDTAGIRTDPADAATAAPRLNRAQIDELITGGAIDGGMLPKVQACFEAMGHGGPCRVSIVDGREPLALLKTALDEPEIPGTRIA